MKPLKLFISAIAFLLLAIVGLGLALPGTWEVERTATVPAPPEVVFDYLDSVEGWAAWAPLAAVDGERSGPDRGPGARLSWDSPEWGQGEWELTGTDRPRSVTYEVRVEEGSMITRGRLALTPEGAETRVDWVESGDFGWNPVLAFMALGMDRMQGREMEKSLDALRARFSGTPPPDP